MDAESARKSLGQRRAKVRTEAHGEDGLGEGQGGFRALFRFLDFFDYQSLGSLSV